MNLSPIKNRTGCVVCGLESFRHNGWFLVVENRWLDRLKILSWHSSLATQRGMKSVCCREHLKDLIAHWLTQASLGALPVHGRAMPIGSDPTQPDIDLGPNSAGHMLGELSVHRESLSRVWSGSAAALECILDALIMEGARDIEGARKRPRGADWQLFDLRPKPTHGISLQ